MSAGLNMDRTRRVVVETSAIPWEPAPTAGVWRRKLEREGAESGRVTSIVRFEPGASFPGHPHPLGEEILVLSGEFEDENGVYPEGTYLRNPPGSRHRPHCPRGCELLVKLDQFDPADLAAICIHTGMAPWHPASAPGLSSCELHRFESERVSLQSWAPGTRVPSAELGGVEELYVLTGTLSDEGGIYPAGTWLRNPPGTRPERFSEAGCKVYQKITPLPQTLAEA